MMLRKVLAFFWLIGMGLVGLAAFPFLLGINVILAYSIMGALALQILSSVFLLFL